MDIKLLPAEPSDAPALAALHTAAARNLTARHGTGPWTSKSSEKGVLFAMRMRNSVVFVARHDEEIIATLHLGKKKPWAIDSSYFAPCQKPLYLVSMAVAPAWQRRGVGRGCLKEVERIAKEWPADAIRLDAYDAKAGAGSFYARCGYTEVGRATYRDTPLIYYELRVV